MRSVLNRSYDFRTRLVRPSWRQALTTLDEEYDRLADLDQQRRAFGDTYGVEGDIDGLIEQLAKCMEKLRSLPKWIVPIHGAMLKSGKAARIVERIADADTSLGSLDSELGEIMDAYRDCRLDELRESLDQIVGALDDLPAFLQCASEIADLPDVLAGALRRMPLPPRSIEAATADYAMDRLCQADRQLRQFSEATRRRHVDRLEGLYEQWFRSNAKEIRRRSEERFQQNIQITNRPAAQLSAEEKQFKSQYNRGRRVLEHEFGKSMRYKSIRDLVSGDSGEVVKDLKPVWLMSPLSVSDTLPLDDSIFDVVIFDEASQITLEEAIPSIFRASQAIVVGDQMQLPPTDFFSAKSNGGDEDDELLVEEDGQLVQYDLESDSFLNHSAKNLASTMLGWHYRSRSESLISFSNWAFYDGRLLTVPEESVAAVERAPLAVTDLTDADSGADELLDRSISFHFMENGVYEKRCNRAEADYIAHLVRELLRKENGRSIGIVAFSEAQQAEIEGALQRLAQEDTEFGNMLDAEQEREVDGQFVGLLVKNLENIQGDERDIIILSVCYGYAPDGKMRMNFGPINKSGGEKRLNVAFSRAKHHMALVSSIRYGDITNDYNDGANSLKNYLRYAEAVSIGDAATADRVLQGMSRWGDASEDSCGDSLDPVAEQLADALVERGFIVDRSVGQSHFRCDLAVRRDGDPEYRLGILLDNAAYYEQSDLLERDMMRPKLLRNFGWNVAFVLAKDWHENSTAVLERLLRILDGEDDPIEDEVLDDEPLADEDESDAEPELQLAPPDAPLKGEPSEASAEDEPSDGDSGVTRYLEYTDDTSNKFWEITIQGNQHTVRYGRVGNKGRTKTKQFDDELKARHDYQRLIRSKLAKGYVEK